MKHDTSEIYKEELEKSLKYLELIDSETDSYLFSYMQI